MSAVDPRARVSFEGIDYHGTTYKYGATIVYDGTKAGGAAAATIGKAVSLSADNTVDLIQDGERVVGKLIKVEDDGFCTVQDDGFCTLPAGASATVTIGLPIVGALGASSARGYVRAAASNSDPEARDAVGRIVENDTLTAMVVEL
jgi:hypothetical protein